MINARLVWYLEINNLISPVQSGFRSERSTNDNLVRLETFIREAFVKKEHVVAVFFDLEKAYDTTWKYGILRDLHELGVKGRLAIFLESFIAERSIQVRVKSTLSDTFRLSQGVPRRPSYGVYTSQLIRFAPVCSHVDDFNTRNKCLTAKLLKQGYWYHKLRKAFSKFYRRHYELISKFNVGLKSLLHQGLSEPEFYGDLVYKFNKIRGITEFSDQFRKIIMRYKRIGYNLNVMRQSACLVINPITVDGYAALFNCTPVDRASDSMMAPT